MSDCQTKKEKNKIIYKNVEKFFILKYIAPFIY